MVRILEGGSEGGGEGEELNDDECSPKDDEDSKDGGTLIEVAAALPSHLEPKTEAGDFAQPEPMLTASPAIQLSVHHDPTDMLQDAELDAEVQQKLLSEIPFKMEDRSGGDDQPELREPDPVTALPVPYADSTTSQPEHIPYLSKRILPQTTPVDQLPNWSRSLFLSVASSRIFCCACISFLYRGSAAAEGSDACAERKS